MIREPVNSSNLVSIGYDDVNHVLEIEFHNGLYRYYDVPSHIHAELMSADSKGSYLHNNVKNHFSYEKL